MVHSDNQTHAPAPAAPRPGIATVGELRASGHAYETVKEEIRRNLLAAMRAGEHRIAGIIGFDPCTTGGIFCLNELPDLAERIQVSLLNVLEERDIGVRGYALRLPLDLLLVASANPEDYTSRGRIITPLKDRFGAEIRTHYPLSLSDELALIRQEAQIAADSGDASAALPDHLVEVIARFTRLVRASPAVDSRSAVSARFAIAAAASAAASAVPRAAIAGEPNPV